MDTAKGRTLQDFSHVHPDEHHLTDPTGLPLVFFYPGGNLQPG
jgi:hypothetical protein